MKKLKQYFYIILFTSLVIVFLFVFSYMKWIHTPYVAYQTESDNVLSMVIHNHDYVYQNYFYKYVGNDIYYVGYFLDEDRKIYIAFDQDGNELNQYISSIVEPDVIYQQFFDKYNVSPQSIDIGYEDGKFFYFVKYADGNVLIYAYYDLRTGEFTKGQQL